MQLKVKHKYINLLSHSPCSLSPSLSAPSILFFAESAPSLSRPFLLYLIGLQWLGQWVIPWVVGLGCGSHLRLKMKGLLWVLGFGLRLNMSSSMVCQRSFSFWLQVEDERFAVGFGFWLEDEDERVYRDCILLRIFLVFRVILRGNLQMVAS